MTKKQTDAKSQASTLEAATKTVTKIESKKATTTGAKTTAAAKKVQTPEEKAAAAALLASIQAQLIGTHMLKAGEKLTDEGVLQKEVTNVMASNGLFKVFKKPVGLFIEKVQEFPTPIAGFEPLEEGVQLLIPKIPGHHLIRILNWYRDVNAKDKTEASNLFFWNHNNVEIPTHYQSGKEIKGVTVDGQLIIYTPMQTNTATLSEFHEDGMVDWFRENMAILCEWHSHNTMGAFFSGTDDANENMMQFYGVWGKVTDERPAFVLRYVIGNTRKLVPLSYLFDIPQIEMETKKTVTTKTEVSGEIKGDLSLVVGNTTAIAEPKTEEREEVVKSVVDYSGPWPELDYPDDWMEQHKKKYQYSQTSWTGGSGGRNYYDGYGYDDYYAGRSSYDYQRSYYDQDLRRYVYPGDAAYDESRAPKKGGAKKSERQIGFIEDDDFRGGDRSKKGQDGLVETDADDESVVIRQNPILNLELSFGDGNDDTESNRLAILEALTQLSEDFIDGEIAYFKEHPHDI